MRKMTALRWLGCLLLMAALAATGGYAHAYGGGGDVGGPSSDDPDAFGPLTSADLINAFGTPAQKEELEREIQAAKNRLEKAQKMADIKRTQHQIAKKKLKELEREIRDGDNSLEKENEYFNMWKKVIQKQNEFLNHNTAAIVAVADLGRAEDGAGGLTESQRKRLENTFNKDANDIRKVATESMLQSLLEHVQNATDEADAADRNMQRAEMVKWVAVAGGVIVGGAGAATLTAAQAAKLLLISKTLDVTGAAVGSVADSYSKGQSATETVVRSLSAATLQAVAGKVLDKVPGTQSATADALVEFSKAYGTDALQSALAEVGTGPALSAAPSSAPNYSPGVPTQQYHR